jgi:uncharacterized protein (TIGR00369 family)
VDAELGVSERRRTYAWEDPLLAAAIAGELTGIEALRRMAAGDVPPAPFAQTLGFDGLVEVSEGKATFAVRPAEFHYNPIGVVHGGLALALLDSAMGCAVHSTLPAGATYTTLEVKANFVRPLTAATGLVRCRGSVVHRGRTIATAEGRVEDSDGKLYAHGTSTLLIMSATA